MEATCSHPVAEVTVFSKQRAKRRRRTRWPWATSTRCRWWLLTHSPNRTHALRLSP